MSDINGRSAMLMPHGILFRHQEKKMRQAMIESDVVECVIGLGKNLFYNSSMKSCIVICRSQKEDSKEGKILFVDAEDDVLHDRSMSFLLEDHIEKIALAYSRFEN